MWLGRISYGQHYDSAMMKQLGRVHRFHQIADVGRTLVEQHSAIRVTPCLLHESQSRRCEDLPFRLVNRKSAVHNAMQKVGARTPWLCQRDREAIFERFPRVRQKRRRRSYY